ncbi:hypothetical protein QBC46DRAFT_385832 [Diplogelasinospora grovesii]|uniref:Uncharacterized protein n=1 Tax=Diplogelasinospora grovesii TaxID=303347 RepID=A0AAN6N6W4_9PEZI|nr:hypothetical protein QBC46DRAFT_385832 [Diplogelasinospora grovesii]
MQFLTIFLMVGLSAWSCAAAPAEEYKSTITTAPIPPSCTATVNGLEKTHSCYTYTHTTHPLACPKIQCPVMTDRVCPQYIVETTVTVPCSTDCCPTTPTTYVTTPCQHCATTCVTPTNTVTETTGCETTAGYA